MRRFLIIVMAAAAIMSILAAGCGSAKNDTNTTRLAGTSWILASYGEAANPKAVISGSTITLVFNAASDQVHGNGGVNGYGGEVQLTDNQITVTQIIRTEMASTNQAINDQENAYFQILQASQSLEFRNNSFTIHCQGGQELVFNAE